MDPNQTIDHPLAHIDEEEQYSLPRMMAEVSLPSSASQQSLTMLERVRPSQHGQCLTLSDHDRLRIFVHEFQVRGLIPWAERTMRILNEQVSEAAAKKKGAKKWKIGDVRYEARSCGRSSPDSSDF